MVLTQIKLFALIAGQEVNIEITQGRLFGIRVDEEDGEYHFEFRKIPYAEPPVGELRFRDPLPKGPWEKPLNATTYGPVCAQPGVAVEDEATGYAGSEDCLYLNVHTPRIPKSGGSSLSRTSLLPVMVYFHGGGFSGGSANDLKTDWILQKDVVVVTLNYRVGALGFLTLGNSYVAGNMGLKDQLLALKWVNENIKTFGGDPAKVTLFGTSAGGMSAHLHQLSPQGNNLYRGVIAMSGSALHFATPMVKGHPEWTGQMFVNRLGCQKGGITDIVWCLQECLVTDILALSPAEFNYANSLENDLRNEVSLSFIPNVDHYSQNPFMPDLPINIMRQGKQKDIPIIMGTVEDEGALWALVIWRELDEFNGNWTYHGPRLMYYDDVNDIPYHHELVANVTQHFYTGGLNFSQNHAQGIINMFTDQQFLAPAIKSAKLQEQTQKSPVYFYELTHKPSISIVSLFGSGIAEESMDWGVTHGDDLVYLVSGVERHQGCHRNRRGRDDIGQHAGPLHQLCHTQRSHTISGSSWSTYPAEGNSSLFESITVGLS